MADVTDDDLDQVHVDDGGPSVGVRFELPGATLTTELRTDQAATIVIDGWPALGITADGVLGWWPDGETFVPIKIPMS